MSIEILTINAGGGGDTWILAPDVIAAMFKTEGRAINIHNIIAVPAAFGSSQSIVVIADPTQKDIVDVAFGALANEVSVFFGAAEEIEGPAQPQYKTHFPFTVADIAERVRSFSVFPVYGQLAIGWNADVDFELIFDYTILPVNLDYREVFMRLLANKKQVEDPNIDATQGKRSLVRAGLRLAEN